MEKDEIVQQHDYNLNIRRYVDNTPAPEPEDVQAHLIGGIPEIEVSAKQSEFAKFEVQPKIFFEPLRPDYLAFRAAIDAKNPPSRPGWKPMPVCEPGSPPTTARWNTGGRWRSTTSPNCAQGGSCPTCAPSC